MKNVSSVLLALLTAFVITACGEKPAADAAGAAADMATEAMGDAADMATEAAGDAVEAAGDAAGAVADAVTTGGGYTPADGEMIEGVTMTAEELAAEAARIDAM